MTELTKEALEQTLDGKLTHLRDDLMTHIDTSAFGLETKISGLETKMQDSFASVDLKLDAIYQLLDVR